MRRACLLLTLLLLAAPLGAQGSSVFGSLRERGANPAGPFATLGRRADATTDTLDGRDLASAVVARARAQVGARYRYAGSSRERGFDCSGLVRYVLGAFGIDVPHNSARIAGVGTAVPVQPDSLRPGDLLTFTRGRSTRISHVGIYVGEGRMVHAATTARGVVESTVPLRGALTLRGVRRVLPDSAAGASAAIPTTGPRGS